MATVVALAIGLWSGWISLRGILGQQKINESQHELNHSLIEQARKRYAQRVSFWVEQKGCSATDCKGVVYIENRAPAGISWPMLVSGYKSPLEASGLKIRRLWYLHNLPACSSVAIQMSWPLIEPNALIFGDHSTRWILWTYGPVEELEPKYGDVKIDEELTDNTLSRPDIGRLSDCAEAA